MEAQLSCDTTAGILGCWSLAHQSQARAVLSPFLSLSLCVCVHVWCVCVRVCVFFFYYFLIFRVFHLFRLFLLSFISFSLSCLLPLSLSNISFFRNTSRSFTLIPVSSLLFGFFFQLSVFLISCCLCPISLYLFIFSHYLVSECLSSVALLILVVDLNSLILCARVARPDLTSSVLVDLLWEHFFYSPQYQCPWNFENQLPCCPTPVPFLTDRELSCCATDGHQYCRVKVTDNNTVMRIGQTAMFI